MRSFGSRQDTAVLDEPFYAPFLAASGQEHPGLDEIFEAHETDPVKVAALCRKSPADGKAYFFQKHMPHQMLPAFPLGWAVNARHFFLIREPRRVISSYHRTRDAASAEDVGFAPQRRIYDTLCELTGTAIPVIDSLDILKNPERALNGLCQALNIPFDAAMLSWEAGPRPEDGAWAPYWYASVEKSTAFGEPPDHMPEILPQYSEILAACEIDYAHMAARKLHF